MNWAGAIALPPSGNVWTPVFVGTMSLTPSRPRGQFSEQVAETESFSVRDCVSSRKNHAIHLKGVRGGCLD
jgi:hypothetical protein